MRVIIEIENEDDLTRLTEILRDAQVTVIREPARPAPDRRAVLQRLFSTYRVDLPDGFAFDRDEAHER